MTTTPAPPLQWEAVEWEHETGRIVRYQIPFAGRFLQLFKYNDIQPWQLTSHTINYYLLLRATTPEQAVYEAVVTLSKHLNGLLEDLAAIPTTLPPTT